MNQKRFMILVKNLIFLLFFVALIGIVNAIDWNTTSDLNPTNWIENYNIFDVAYDSNNELLYLVGNQGIFGVYNKTSGITEDLRGTDPGDFIGTQPLPAVAYDSNRSLVYFGGVEKFAVYNRTSNITENLIETDLGDWFGDYLSTQVLIYDSNDSLIYLAALNAAAKGMFGVYNRSDNTSYNLNGTDPGDWLGTSRFSDMTYDSNNGLLYFVGENDSKGVFGFYNTSDNTTYNLSGKLPDWGGQIPYGLTYDSSNNLVYLAGTGGKFAVYNRTANATTDLSDKDPGNWIGTTWLRRVTYDSNNGLAYLVGDNGVFGAYNRTSDVTEDLRTTDNGNWLGTNSFYGLTYDSTNNLLYLVGSLGNFRVYNITSNITSNLRATGADDWIGVKIINVLTSSNSGLIYLAGNDGVFGAYNRTLDNVEDLRGRDVGDWIQATTLDALTYDSTNNFIYLGGENGKFGYYNRNSNISYNLTETDTGNWIGTSTIYDLTYDSNNDLVYLVGPTSKFGVYNRTNGTNGTTTDLSPSWEYDLYAVTYDYNKDLVYMGGYYRTFGVYNRTSGIKENISMTFIGEDWGEVKNIKTLAYDSNNSLIYVAGTGGLFGVYNRTDNITYNLNLTDLGNWIGTTTPSSNLNALAYDLSNGLLYLVGNNGIFGAYNKTSGITEDLRTTDENNWIGTTNLNGATYDPNSGLIYLAGAKGIFGAYNRTANVTVQAEAGETPAPTTPTPGGGIVAGQPTQTHTWDVITANEPATMPIIVPEIHLIEITVVTIETLTGASLTVTKIDVTPQSDILIRADGENYQGFKIDTTKINETNIANVTIKFRVNKTWLQELNLTYDDVSLYRKPGKPNKWDALNTSFVSEDSEYYYFSAVSPGFSTFVIFIGTRPCNPGDIRCFNNELQLCVGDYTWVITKKCRASCENNECIRGSIIDISSGSLLVYIVVVILTVGLLVVLYFVFRFLSKKRSQSVWKGSKRTEKRI